MCFSETHSWTAFTVGTLFTIFNIVVFNKKLLYVLVSIFWYFGVSMQFWEGLLWSDKKDDPKFSKTVTHAALINNILQPVVILLLLFLKENRNVYLILLSFSIALFYLTSVFLNVDMTKYDTIEEKDKKQISLLWWNPDVNRDKMLPVSMYFITIILLISLLGGPTRFKVFTIGLFMASFTISYIIYNKKKDVGSVWCYFAAFIPFFNAIYFYYN
tara:strand:+ start:12876 stop:13520 length:645 start_codon:yes stop_codon:yes gene_type:complete